MSIAKTMSIITALFMAITLMHAAFVDYRSNNSESRMQETKQIIQMTYLQARKFGVDTQIMFGECWRGRTRQKWMESGMCPGAFEILVQMKGGPTRMKLLHLLAEPKNRLQLSRDIGLDWKAIDRHIEKMQEFGLVETVAVVGTCTVYARTEKGRRALTLAQCQA